MADSIVDIADDSSEDWVQKTLKNGETKLVLNKEHIRRSALRCQVRMWYAGKLAPKRWGDKVGLENAQQG